MRKARIMRLEAFLSPKDIQYYDHIKRELKHSQRHKAMKFLEHNCIIPAADGIYQCLPIPGYNTRVYILKQKPDGSWSCNCQGYISKEARGEFPICSHIYALLVYLGIISLEDIP